MKKDSAKANSRRDTFEATESLSETSVSTNSISQNAGNVNSEAQKGKKFAVGLSIICYTIGIKICEVFIGREPT